MWTKIRQDSEADVEADEEERRNEPLVRGSGSFKWFINTDA